MSDTPSDTPAAPPSSTPSDTASATTRHASPALWQLLQQVARLVQAVQGGQNTSTVLADVPQPLRPGTQALGFDVLRALGCGQWLCQALVPRRPAPLLHGLLCAALALLWRQSDAGPGTHRSSHYSHFTLVNQAVEAARRHPKIKHQANLVNAVLRRYLREQAHWNDQLQQAAPHKQAALLNLPAWWWQQLCTDYGTQQAQAIVQAQQQPAPLVLRVNARWGTPQQYIARLQQEAGMAAHQQGTHGVVLQQAVPVQQLPGFAQGHVSVQDAAAQLAAPMLLHALGLVDTATAGADANANTATADTAPATSAPPICPADHGEPSPAPAAACPARSTGGLRLLDACAAPGGKTAHLLELLHRHPHDQPHHVLALEHDAQRCTLIHQTLQRLHLLPDPEAPSAAPAPSALADSKHDRATVAVRATVEVRAADAGQPQDWWDGQPFDGILLDAPCTASGIVRRHPDVPWLRRASDIAQLATQQRRLLDALWPLLRPGGVLLYCTCSVFHAEGQQQIEAFLLRHSDAQALAAAGHLLPTPAGDGMPVPDNASPHAPQPAPSPRPSHDGFFYALLRKTSTPRTTLPADMAAGHPD